MQVGGLSQKDIMSEWKRAFLISQTSRAKPMEQREQKPTDGAARGEAKLAWAIPSRDRGRQSQTCLDYAEISCKREQSQACLAVPSAADIQRS